MNGSWTRETISGKTADVYQPAGDRPRHGVLYLHGAGLETLIDKPAFTRLFDELKLTCVCPHGQRSWWTDRICREFDQAISPERFLVDQVVPFIQKRWQIGPRGIGLLGVSMGGQGALRLAFRYPHLFPVAAGIASALDFHETYGQGTPLDEMYDSKEQCRQDTALMHVPPNNYPPHIYFSIDPGDVPWFRGNDRLHEKLSALGIEHVADLTTEGGGHSWDYFNKMAEPAVRFVSEGLEKESRRLL
jgi:S-formylglutathione hydrolase FrmB